MILAGCLQSRLLTWWLLIHVNCKCSKLLLRRSPVPEHQGGLGLSSGDSLYRRELGIITPLLRFSSCMGSTDHDSHEATLLTVTNPFPSSDNCVCRSHIRIWYKCHVPSPCHIRHVSRVSVRKSALLPSNIHCSLTPIRLSDTNTRALRNQMDCYSNCHGTCYAATIVNWIKLWDNCCYLCTLIESKNLIAEKLVKNHLYLLVSRYFAWKLIHD